MANLNEYINISGNTVIATQIGNASSYLYGNGSNITGISGSSYGDSNVSAYLSSGTDTGNIITTGNVSGGNITTAGLITATGNVTSTGNVSGGNITTAGLITATGNVTSTGNVSGGNIISTANIKVGGQIQSTSFSGGNILWSAANQTDFQGSIKLGGSGLIKSPGGATSITVNNNGANIGILGVTNGINATSTTSGALIVTGGTGISGNVYVGRNLVVTPFVFSGLPATPAVGTRSFLTDANLVAAGNFGAQVSGGGSNSVPVWSDGTNWYIG